MPFCVVSEGSCYFQGWFFKGGTACHCELCNSFAKSNCFDYDSLTVAFPSGQQLCWVTKSQVYLILSLNCYYSLWLSLSALHIVVLWQKYHFNLKVLTEVTLPDAEASPSSLIGFLMVWPSLALPDPLQHKHSTVCTAVSYVSIPK